MDIPPHDYYSVREIAEAFRVSKMTINRMIQRGDLAAIRFGKQFRIPRAEVERLTAEGTAARIAG